jgi:hypothetical protein
MKKILYISHLLFSLFVIYGIFDMVLYLYKCHTGMLIGDPLGVPFSYVFIGLFIGVLIMEYLIIFKKKGKLALIISIILAVFSGNNILSAAIQTLGLSGIIQKMPSETWEKLTTSIFYFIFYGFFFVTHYWTSRTLNKFHNDNAP